MKRFLSDYFWLFPLSAAFFLAPLNAFRPSQLLTWGDIAMVGALVAVPFRLSSLRALTFPPSVFFLPVIPLVCAATLAFVDFGDFDDLSMLAQMLIAYFAMPVIVILGAQGYRSSVAALTWSWIAGVTFSALIGIFSHHGHSFLGFYDRWADDPTSNYRIAGLAYHPNMFAIFTTVALPALIGRAVLARSMLERVCAYAALPVLLYGIKLSGSRAALGTSIIVCAIFACFYMYRSKRRALSILQVIFAAAVLVTAYVSLSNGRTLDASERLFQGGEDTSISDRIRGSIHQEAWEDFVGSPLYGVGLRKIRVAHDIYLQFLQCAGVLGLGGFLLYVYLLLRSVWLGMRRFAANRVIFMTYFSLGCALLAWLIAASNQNAVIERGVCMPIYLILLLFVETFYERGEQAVVSSQSDVLRDGSSVV